MTEDPNERRWDDDPDAAAWKAGLDHEERRNRRHMRWAVLLFFVVFGVLAWDNATDRTPAMRALYALLVGGGAAAFFAGMCWLLVHGSRWAGELPFRIRHRWRQRRGRR
ncbi:hypothetical protein IMZ29_17345 [Achromobacter sp. GG226]|uniref:hypothetical protein n=1 Tax=Verticiella alkaliphila TaxID=2779529 RepID=UPI001C0E779C|nr:hypothetical protein [Verticiella sp. GG226]MBU4612242.1 hypothetical protein [Verticiella sp. GG226]